MRNRKTYRKLQKKKTITISFVTLTLLIILSFIGVKTYTYISTPRVISPKVESIKTKENTVVKPNETKKNNVSLSFQDGKELESTESIRVTETGKLPERQVSKEKVAYLTFDDGPTANVTPVVLEVLKKHNVKATFFVLGKMAEKHPEILKKEFNDGHLIGNHTYSHDYKYIYSTPDNFISDIKKGEETINKILGLDGKVQIIRFPGGSFPKKLENYRQAAAKNGYYYIDWNSLNGDAEGGKKNEAQLIDRLIKTSKGKKELVILMHDAATKMATANSLGQIIEYLKSSGYRFDTLNNYYK
ncbi:polysaccharide deacetylase family protein [Clostridium cylindrosporum]|uniref:Putative polysaccharide deacetylase YheN n=1 Tax=Clostridium cylindrosporum DSM 605 TaxID=1121307 RepID=A0A0J8G002_CLOCY|nr:polysaccharide deacetylase family protein [Clostridium cylindrosporum]KMT21131.1 putative polysaccharide deacetylase YheN [Clostridium cylindrosporum DSM 605]